MSYTISDLKTELTGILNVALVSRTIHDWFSKRLLDTPTTENDSLIESAPADAHGVCPFGKRFRYAVVYENNVIPLIASLFGSGSPTAIFRSVVSVVIDPIQRMFLGWSEPHIGKKVLEGFKPSVANLDTSPSVEMESGIGSSIAPVSHMSPYPVFLGMPHAKLSSYFSKILFSPATATSHLDLLDRSVGSCEFISTVASTRPYSVFPLIVWHPVQYNKLLESLSGQINKFSHMLLGYNVHTDCQSLK